MTDLGLDKIDLLSKRDFERKLDIQKRKEDRKNQSADNEKIGYFEETFTTKRDHIEKLIEESEKIDKHRLPEHFNAISNEILLLQKYVAASNIFLRSYDIKRCHESLQELSVKAKELESELLPKKKFGFKGRTQKNNKPSKIVEPEKKQNEAQNGQDEADFATKNTVFAHNLTGFSNLVGQTLTLTREQIFKRDVVIENLTDCQLYLFGTPSTLHLNNLKNCRVVSGPTSTSIFGENCENCTLVIACQQLRLHSSRNVKIYLHVTSRAIMEDCHGILVTPYNLEYDGIDEDFEASGLDISTNNWKCIDDFNWLSSEKKSPNWDVLDENLIESNWNV